MKQELVWSEALLDDGNQKTQNEWIAWLADKKNNPNGYRLPTVKEYEALNLGKNMNADLKEGIRRDLVRFWLMTADTLTSPFTGEVRALVLGVGNGRFGIDASNNFYSDGPARGVVATKKTSTRNKGKRKAP